MPKARITDLRSAHPPITDGDGRVWTWRPRGEGYVLHGLTDHDWKGRPAGVQADTIRDLWGRPAAKAAAS